METSWTFVTIGCTITQVGNITKNACRTAVGCFNDKRLDRWSKQRFNRYGLLFDVFCPNHATASAATDASPRPCTLIIMRAVSGGIALWLTHAPCSGMFAIVLQPVRRRALSCRRIRERVRRFRCMRMNKRLIKNYYSTLSTKKVA